MATVLHCIPDASSDRMIFFRFSDLTELKSLLGIFLVAASYAFGRLYLKAPLFSEGFSLRT